MIEWLIKVSVRLVLITIIYPSLCVMGYFLFRLVVFGDMSLGDFFLHLAEYSYDIVVRFYADTYAYLVELPRRLVR